MLYSSRPPLLRVRRLALLAASALLCTLLGCEEPYDGSFREVSSEAGLDYVHGFENPGFQSIEARISGGVASGDVDGDGFIDLYVVRGSLGPNLLFRNRGDGSFEEIGAEAGVDLSGGISSGPLFADLDGDGDLDLVVGGVDGQPIHVFANRGDGRFDDFTAQSGIHFAGSTFSAAAADYDRDGDLDLFLTHWNTVVTSGSTGHLWRNDGTGRFVDVSIEAGISSVFPVATEVIPHNVFDFTFTPNFADIDGDGWPDLLLTSDFDTTRLLRNRGDGRFEDITPEAISDQNGMGAAIGDFDGDLDLDWFVSSIFDLDIPGDANWGGSGNRLYRNDGGGAFSDVTGEAFVREGYWGWGACMADFDLDGVLDLFHVNGFRPAEGFDLDPSRLFIGNGDGTFTERSVELALDDHGNGRGVVCFDYDRDGDIDIFVANNDGPPSLFRNDLESANRSLTVRLRGLAGNTEGIGARIYLRTPTVALGPGGGLEFTSRTQLREVRAGSNFVSQNPAEAIFGLGRSPRASRVRVVWPDGAVSTLRWPRARGMLTIEHPSVRGHHRPHHLRDHRPRHPADDQPEPGSPDPQTRRSTPRR